MISRNPLIPWGIALMMLGCQKSEPPKTPVARIDDQTLTLEQIKTQLDTTRGISQAQMHEYIQRWLTDEILYREALRRGLDQNREIGRRLGEIRRQLIINALLEREIYSDRTAQISQEEVAAYYANYKNEFVLPGEVALVSFVLFREREPANAFRTKMLQGTPWSDGLRKILSDPQQAPTVLMHVDSLYFTQATLLPPELWRVATATTRSEPSFPVRTENGFYILVTWKFSKRGQVADLPYVEKEIRSRLTIERRRRMLDSLVENLRAKHSVEILVTGGGNEKVSTKKEE